MYRNEQHGQNTAVVAAVKDGVLASHRSLPDHERSGLARISFERESVTERRGKKKSKLKVGVGVAMGNVGEPYRARQPLPRLSKK